MKVMVFVKATPSSEAETYFKDPKMMEKLFAEMGKYNEELVKAGIMKGGDGLKPSKFGKRIRFNGPKRTVIDGPFAETKELVAEVPEPDARRGVGSRDPAVLRSRGFRRGLHGRRAGARGRPAQAHRRRVNAATM
jgi:hypothetical protein